MKNDKFYLLHIQQSIKDIEAFVIDGKDAFKESRLIQNAVLYSLQTLSESTQQLSDELKATHTEIQWDAIRGFRNRLVHAYLTIDLDYVWEIVTNFLPPLKHAIEAMLSE